MNVAHLFRSAGVERQDRLADGRSKGFRVILERGARVSNEREERRARRYTSYATFEYPFCSSTLFTRVWASLKVDWTLPETVCSGPRARWPADLSRSDMNDKNFLEIPCLSTKRIRDQPWIRSLRNTYCRFRWHAGGCGRTACSPWRDTRQQLEGTR